MATLEQQQKAKSDLEAVLTRLAAYKVEDLRSRKVGDDIISFAAGVPFFERLLKLYADLQACPLDILPFQVLNNLLNIANQAVPLFENVKNLNPQQGNASQLREQYINNIRDAYDEHHNVITPTIAFASRLGYDFAGLERKAKESLAKMDQASADMTKILNDFEKKAEQTLAVMQKAAAEMGVSQQAIYFKEEADKHTTESAKWLKYTLWMTSITVGVAIVIIVLYLVFDPQFSTARLIQLAIAKLFILSVLYYGVIWTGKNYRAHQHNSIVNRHRQNSLSTFKAFVEGTDDPSTKNAVLIRSTEAVFSPVSSGFSSSESESSGSPQIMEIIRGVSEVAKSTKG